MLDQKVRDTLSRLQATREDLTIVVERLKPEQLPLSAREGEWHTRRVLEHMANAERRYTGFISATRTALNSVAEVSLSDLVAEWQRVRQDLLRELELVKPEQFQQRVPGHDRTILEYVELAIGHDKAHIQQLNEILQAAKSK